MSKRGEFRQFHLGFWQSADVEALDPIEKLLYVYMITSPKSNMEGVYKTTLRRIAFETGIDRDMIPRISARFEDAGIGGILQDSKGAAWIVISNAPDFMPGSPNIITRINEQIEDFPEELVKYLYRVNYRWPEWDGVNVPVCPQNDKKEGIKQPLTNPSQGVADPLPTPMQHDTIQYDTILDLDKYNTSAVPSAEADASHDESPTSPNLPATTEVKPAPKSLAPLKDPVSRLWEDALTQIQPPDTWGNIAKERKSAQTLGQRSANLITQSPYETLDELITAVLSEYRKLKSEARPSDTYWGRCSFTPSDILARWPQVWTSLASRHEKAHKQREYEESLSGVVF